MKILWRFILPLVLAILLAGGLTLGLMERSVWWPTRPWYFQRGYLYIAAAIFAVLFVASMWKTLNWGKESEEYAELLKDEQADEEKRRGGGTSR